MAAAAAAPSKNISWGSMITGAAKIVAAITVVTVCSWFLSGFIDHAWNQQLSPEFKDWVLETGKEAQGIAKDVWDSAIKFFTDFGSAGADKSAATQFVEDAWKNDWVKGGTIAAGLGVVALGATKLFETSKSSPAQPAAKPSQPEESFAYREIKRRLDMRRAEDLSR